MLARLVNPTPPIRSPEGLPSYALFLQGVGAMSQAPEPATEYTTRRLMLIAVRYYATRSG